MVKPHSKVPIVFSHANGFPAGVYRSLFERWRAAGHAVHAIERIGHDPAFPVTSNWPQLCNELIAFIEREAAVPLWSVGHSLGGMLSLMAASHRPDLVRGVVLLDSPVIAGWRARGLQLAKATGLMPRVTPSRIARRRRESWPTRAAIRAHFGTKRVFARWDPEVFEDYVECGFVRRSGQWRLAFDRAIEARIYETLPHHLGRLLAGRPLQCPLAFIGGNDSVEARQAGMARTASLAGERLLHVPGSHLFPMEHPRPCADAVLAMLASMTRR